MELVVPVEKALSYLDLVDRHPEAFYYPRSELITWSLAPLLSVAMPVRKDVIDFYTSLFESGEVRIERSFPRELADIDHLPNIVELTVWWLSYMQIHKGYHGMRSMRTPSSTPFGDRILCVYLMVNDMLTVSAHDRRNTIVAMPGRTFRTIP